MKTTASTSSTRRGAGRSARRGLTIVEVVLAASLAALIAVTVSSTLGYIYRAQGRHRQQLACAELCHRLLLQYLDDKELMPNVGLPLRYGPDLYRFRWQDDPIIVTPARPRTVTPNSSVGGAGIDRFRQVTVEVWLDEESGYARRPAPGRPHHALTRVADPLPFRSPDAMNRLVATEEGLAEMVGVITGGAGRGSVSSDRAEDELDTEGQR